MQLDPPTRSGSIHQSSQSPTGTHLARPSTRDSPRQPPGDREKRRLDPSPSSASTPASNGSGGQGPSNSSRRRDPRNARDTRSSKRGKKG